MEQNEQKNADNPRENANIVSALTFWYALGLFKKGYNKVLGIDDLFKPLKVDESGALGDRLERFVDELMKYLHADNKWPA